MNLIGNYLKVLYNKYANTDNQKAITYTLDKNIVKATGEYYVEDLYSASNSLNDGRKDETNKNFLLDTIQKFSSQDNQNSQDNKLFKSSDIFKIVKNQMSKDTFYKKLNIVEAEGHITKVRKGEYQVITKNQ